MTPETFLSLATKVIREECIRNQRTRKTLAREENQKDQGPTKMFQNKRKTKTTQGI